MLTPPVARRSKSSWPCGSALPRGVWVDDDVGCWIGRADALFGRDNDYVRLVERQRRIEIGVELDVDIWPARAGAKIVHGVNARIGFGKFADFCALGIGKFAVEQMIGGIARDFERAPAEPRGDHQRRDCVRPRQRKISAERDADDDDDIGAEITGIVQAIAACGDRSGAFQRVRLRGDEASRERDGGQHDKHGFAAGCDWFGNEEASERLERDQQRGDRDGALLAQDLRMLLLCRARSDARGLAAQRRSGRRNR